MADWQPIETAPKDGTLVLVWFRGRMYVAEHVGIYHSDNKHWCVREPPTEEAETSRMVSTIDPPTIEGKSIPGIWSGPTHWMPLPAPPSGSAG